MSTWQPARPWCLPCREDDGSRSWAQYLGVACEWHWGILSDDDQAALATAVRVRHPRGGRARTPIEQIAAVRIELRQQRPPNTVAATWRRDADQRREESA